MIPSVGILSLPVLVGSIAGVLAGLSFSWLGVRLLVRRRQALIVPQSRICEVSLGEFEFCGRAAGPYTIRAPITGAPCFHYRAIAWECHGSGRTEQWKKVAEETLYVPFFLDDGTGTILVDPRGAELNLPREFRRDFNDSLFSTDAPVPPNVRDFLSRYGISSESRLRVDEQYIKAGTPLCIVGTIAENPVEVVAPSRTVENREKAYTLHLGTLDAEPTGALKLASATPSERSIESNAKQEVIRLTPDSSPQSSAIMSQQEKIARALLKAGIQNPAGWSAGEVSPELSAQAAEVAQDTVMPGTAADRNPALPGLPPQSAPTFDLHSPFVLTKGAHSSLLILPQSPRDAARSLRWKAPFVLFIGAFVTLFSLYVLLSYLALRNML